MKKLHVYILLLTSLAVLFSIQDAERIGIAVRDLLLRPDTEYAAGYTHEGFSQIEVGMTEAEVIEILGEPLICWRPYQYTNFIEKRHFVGLQYSDSPSDTHYRLRQVYLENGIVKEVIGYFYID